MPYDQSNEALARILWAKATPTYKSLWHHMIDSGVCAEVLVKDWRFKSVCRLLGEMLRLSEDDVIRFTAYVSSMHDCYGKTHPAFQKKSSIDAGALYAAGLISQVRDREKGYRHERYGEKCFREKGVLRYSLPPDIAKMIGSVIGLHHQGKIGHCEQPKLHRDQWMDMADLLHSMAIDLFQPPLDKLARCAHYDVCVMLLSSLTILSDWIASSEAFAQLNAETDEAYYAMARDVAKDTVERFGLHSGDAFPEVSDYGVLWSFLTEDRLRGVQKTVLHETWPDAELTIIEAPMGEGKTEAGAFYAARLCHLAGKQGIYFALPTAATSNQMHGRIQQMLSCIQKDQPRLMHGMAWLVQDDTPLLWNDGNQDNASRWDWLRPMRRAMLAESGVGTVDQAMMAVLQIRYSCLRLLGMVGKVLVIDEIHAYDAYMSRIIERLLQWCRALRIPVVMLSATLTEEKRRSFVAAMGADLGQADRTYPLITQVKNGQVAQWRVTETAKVGEFTFKLVYAWNSPGAIADLAMKKVGGGGCLCVMMNTVGEAQNVYAELVRKATDSTQIYLFHARMKACHRATVEKQCIEMFGKESGCRPDKAILVCTQVVEQSMDLDFDGMITCIAPIDLLLQRAGRVHRHVRPLRPAGMEIPVISVLVPEKAAYESYGASGVVYDPWLLMQTQGLLPISIAVPGGVRDAIERVYAAPANGAQEWARMKFREKMIADQAKACKVPAPDPEEFFGWNLSDGILNMEEQDGAVAAKTRLSDPTIRIALLDEELMKKAKSPHPSVSVAQEVLSNSFTIRATDDEVEEFDKGTCLLRDVVLIEEKALPVRIGDKTLDYDTALGAVIEGRKYG